MPIEAMNSGLKVLRAGQLILTDRILQDAIVIVSGEKIQAVGTLDDVKIPSGAEILDYRSRTIAPGMIDIHDHGCKGVWGGESLEGTLATADYVLHTGVTSFLPTVTFAPTVEAMCNLLDTAAEAVGTPHSGAQMLGLNFEAPFFTRAPKSPWDRYPPAGLTGGKFARDPSVAELEQYQKAARGLIKVMTIAPELEGALEVIRHMRGMGIIPSIGHTAASYEQAMAGVEAGAQLTTHLYNAMRRFDHREPGVVEAMLTCDKVMAEIIGDGVHVLPPAIDLAIRAKGIDRIILVTDNTSYAGMPNGSYTDDQGREVIKDDEKAYVPGWSLAGSISPMNRNAGVLLKKVGCSLPQIFRMAALNPARLLGISDRKGSIEAGKDADLIVIDQDILVDAVMIKGSIVL
jgi:N-acetylglucosamine-6-phosphate deacetylase